MEENIPSRDGTPDIQMVPASRHVRILHRYTLQEELCLCSLSDVGHSGWTPPQLRRELNDRAWYVSPMVPDICLETDSSKVWAMAMRRLSPLHHIMSHASAQPSLN